MKWRQLPLFVRMAVVAPLWLGTFFVALPLGLRWLGKALHLPELLPAPYHLLGLMPLVLALAAGFVCVALFCFQGKGTPVPYDPPSKLITSGPYAYCRNPMVTSQGIALIGLAILLQAWLMLPALALGFVVFHLYHKLAEERHLVERFGEEYEEYRQNVPMWIPRVKPYRPQT